MLIVASHGRATRPQWHWKRTREIFHGGAAKQLATPRVIGGLCGPGVSRLENRDDIGQAGTAIMQQDKQVIKQVCAFFQ